MRTLIKPDYYLYVAEFSNGVVKIGRSARPGRRFSEYRRELQKISTELTVQRTWASEPTSYTEGWHAETALIASCKAKWPTAHGIEYFNAPFEQVVTEATAVFEAKRYAPRALLYRKQFPRNRRHTAA